VTIQLAFLRWVRFWFKAYGSEGQEFSPRFHNHCGHQLFAQLFVLLTGEFFRPLPAARNLSTRGLSILRQFLALTIFRQKRLFSCWPFRTSREPRHYWSFAPGSAFPALCPCWSWHSIFKVILLLL